MGRERLSASFVAAVEKTYVATVRGLCVRREKRRAKSVTENPAPGVRSVKGTDTSTLSKIAGLAAERGLIVAPHVGVVEATAVVVVWKPE